MHMISKTGREIFGCHYYLSHYHQLWPVYRAILLIMVFLIGTFAAVPVIAQQLTLPPPEQTDPGTLGIMKGFPPPPDKTISPENVWRYPFQRWTFRHMRQLAATQNVWRGSGCAVALPRALKDLDKVIFEGDKGQKISVAEWQKSTYTDALLVLHNGKIVYENYYIGMKPQEPHILWSMTKSFTGLLATMLIDEGKLDPNAFMSNYVPELKDTAWGDATVQQTLDMTVGVRYREEYTDFTSEVILHMIAAGVIAMPPNYKGPKTIYDFLKTLKKEGEHGTGFQYKTCHADALSWVISRVTGKSLAELLSERIWDKIGAEEDAFFMVDAISTPAAGSTLNATLRDLGRFGEMVRLGGISNGKRIIPQAVIDEIRKGADREKFKASGMTLRFGYSYHNQWWITHDKDGTFEGRGVNGQLLHINPAAKLVIVKLSSHPVGSTLFTQIIDQRAFVALAQAIRDND